MDTHQFFDTPTIFWTENRFTFKFYDNINGELRDFENQEHWYLIKFFILCSQFYVLNYQEINSDYRSGNLQMPINCECGRELDEFIFIRGTFNSPFQDNDSHYEFFVRLSEECPECEISTFIFRNIGEVPPPLKIFLSFLYPDLNYYITDRDMIYEWTNIMRWVIKTCIKTIKGKFRDDLIKFDDILKQNYI